MGSIKVVISEKDPLLQKLYADLVKEKNGFSLVKIVTDINQLRAELPDGLVDIVILNFYQNNLNSIEALDALLTDYPKVDYILILERKNPELERALLRRNIFKYFVNPFRFESMKQTLNDYSQYRLHLTKNAGNQDLASSDFTSGNHGYWSNHSQKIPTGLSPSRLDDIEEYLRKHFDTYSSRELGMSLGFSSATARRHLEFLVAMGRIEVKYAYKRIGRPEKRYSILLI